MAKSFDLILSGGELVNHDGVTRRDVGVIGGRIAEIGDLARASAGERVDCRGLTVLPGVIETPSHLTYLSRQADPAAAEHEIDQWQWLGRIGHAEEVGRVCLFLSGEGATFVTGADIVVSGGAELGYGMKTGWAQPLGVRG